MAIVAVLALATGVTAAAQEPDRFVFDNLTYTGASTVGPISFSESQFPTGTLIKALTITHLGVPALPAPLKFTFTVYDQPSTDAAVTSDFDLVPFSGLDGDMVEGTTAGVVGIDFGTDVTSASFGFALNTLDSIASACTVTAFDSAGHLVGSSTASADALISYTEGVAGFKSRTGFRRILVSFASAFPDRIPTLDGWGLALLTLLLGAAGVELLRRVNG
jgi:hypothetical protein